MEFSAETIAVDYTGKPIIAAVVIDQVGIVARFEDGEWIPKYGIRRPASDRAERIEIPPCFFFNYLALALLESLRDDDGPIYVEVETYELPG
ncbi:MAG: hypothetical protein OK454_04535 [Thaumarchaeota archaeon]|nr:hypothetical protein [Nitrososphaerota archaeon]